MDNHQPLRLFLLALLCSLPGLLTGQTSQKHITANFNGSVPSSPNITALAAAAQFPNGECSNPVTLQNFGPSPSAVINSSSNQLRMADRRPLPRTDNTGNCTAANLSSYANPATMGYLTDVGTNCGCTGSNNTLTSSQGNFWGYNTTYKDVRVRTTVYPPDQITNTAPRDQARGLFAGVFARASILTGNYYALAINWGNLDGSLINDNDVAPSNEYFANVQIIKSVGGGIAQPTSDPYKSSHPTIGGSLSPYPFAANVDLTDGGAYDPVANGLIVELDVMDNKLFGRVFKNTGANPTSADLLAEVMLVDGANNTAGANGALNYWRLSSETTLLNSTPTASGDTVNNLNSQFDDLEITQLPIEWTGNTSTAFATAGNWVHNHPPRPWDIMTVPDVSSGSGNFPALAATNEVKWLTLQSNASASQMAANNLTLDSLTIMPNGTHSIGSGTLTINDSLYLRSTASGTGLLVNNSGGAVSIGAGGGVIAERYIPNNSGYHYLSAPVTGQTIGDLGLSNGASPGYTYEPDPALGQPYPSPFPNIFRYDETDVTNNPNVDDDEYGWESYTAAANPMMMPYGYAVNAGAGQTVTYRGGFSGSDFTENLSYSNSGDPAMDGWHLLGNPYTAALDWDQMDATNSGNFSSTVYYWNPATSQYEMYNATTATGMGNAIIPPGQGFFVHNTSGGAANFAVNQSAQVGTASSFYKTSGAAVATHLQLHIENPNGDGDNTFVVFDGGATEQFESRYDAYKLFTDQKVPSLFTQWEGQAYAQSAFPELTQERSVPLHARFEHDGNYTLTAEAVHEFGANDEIWLEDLKTGKLTNFSVASASYNFQATAGEDEGRFMLHFKAGQTTARPGQQHAEVANIYSSGKTVVVEFAQERAAQPAQVSVYSLSGQQVASQERPAQQAQMRMALPHLADGIYLVKVTGQGVSTRRLLLR